MKNTIKVAYFALALVLLFSTAACTAGGGKTFNSAEELKAYLDKQPVNGTDKPIRVTMSANAPMFPNIVAAINSTGKYVSLNFSNNALTNIPLGAFNGCTLLVAIAIPDSVTSIGDNAFRECTSLASLTIPDSVTRIADGAFTHCESLKSVTIPDGVTSIGDGVFRYCTSLASIIIPNSVTSIGHATFQGGEGLKSVTIPNRVASIGFNAFADCTSLASVKFEGTIASSKLSPSAFEGIGDLRAKYLAGGPGTYTRPSGSNTWTKQ